MAITGGKRARRISCAHSTTTHTTNPGTDMKNPRMLTALALAALLAGACADGSAGPTAPEGARYNGGLYGSGGKSDGTGSVTGSGTAPATGGEAAGGTS